MKRARLKKKYIFRRTFSLKHKWFYFLCLIFILFYGILTFLNRRLTPIFMEHSEAEVTKMIRYLMKESIDDELLNDLNVEDLFIITKTNDTIQSVDFNSLHVNKLLQKINKKVWTNMSALQSGNLEVLNEHDSIFQNVNEDKLKRGVVYEIPLGVVFHNTFLSYTGPKVPVKLIFSGNMDSYVKTNIKDYGINNAIIEVTIHIEVEEKILLPLTSKTIKVGSDIPLAVKIIEGSVPNYYSTGIKENSPIVSPSKQSMI